MPLAHYAVRAVAVLFMALNVNVQAWDDGELRLFICMYYRGYLVYFNWCAPGTEYIYIL